MTANRDVPASPPATGKDTSMQDAAVCPYCGHEHSQGDLADRSACDEDERGISCDYCGEDFSVIGSVTWRFSTYPKSRVPASPRSEPPEQYRQILEKLCPECYLAVSSVIAGGP